jgi:hypothetical protein
MSITGRKGPRRPSIGGDPLDLLIPQPTGTSATPVRGGAPRPERSPKVRATFHITEALLEEIRDAVVALSGPPTRLTLAAFAETALRRELDRLRDDRNGGAAFPPRDGELRGGRPIGS